MGDLHLPSNPQGAAFQGAGFEQTKLSGITLILRGRFLVQPRLCDTFSFDLWVWVKYLDKIFRIQEGNWLRKSLFCLWDYCSWRPCLSFSFFCEVGTVMSFVTTGPHPRPTLHSPALRPRNNSVLVLCPALAPRTIQSICLFCCLILTTASCGRHCISILQMKRLSYKEV